MCRNNKKEKPDEAYAGLSGDLEYTSGCIYKNGKPFYDDYTYLSSTWAIPVLIIDGDEIPCCLMQSETKYDCDTKWSESSLKILND